MLEPSPNLLAQSRMRLDEELDLIPPHGLLTRLRSNLYGWLGHMQSAPALVTLLLGVGFLGGNFTYRYQVAHQPKLPSAVVLSNSDQRRHRQHQRHRADAQHRDRAGHLQPRGAGDDAGLAGRSADPPAAADRHQGGRDQRRAHRLSRAAGQRVPRRPPVRRRADGSGIRNALLVSLRYDKNPGVRLKALEGLQPYVAQDQQVRDARARGADA